MANIRLLIKLKLKMQNQLYNIFAIDYDTGIEDVMEVVAKNVELGYMVNLCAYMQKRGKQAQAENIKERILIRFAKNRNEVENMVESKEKELWPCNILTRT